MRQTGRMYLVGESESDHCTGCAAKEYEGVGKLWRYLVVDEMYSDDKDKVDSPPEQQYAYVFVDVCDECVVKERKNLCS